MKKVGQRTPVSLDEWHEGWIACDQGVERHRNPYLRDSEAYEDWRLGWEHRYYNEPREEW